MALSPGQRLGPYEILALLGAGGMGQVYSAADTRLHRTVAIKVLPHEKVADAERKRRFLQEARAASALNHPNIVTLHDMASDSGVDYLVMEYVRGKPLDKLITGKGMPLVEGIGYATEIAGALAAAHAAGIVHRDIKPANVIVTAELQVKVLDFGLAKLVERAPGTEDETKTQAQLTEPGIVMGTVSYMSPEQASAKTVDYRTDIFSLGVVLYEMIAGRRPFQRKTPAETMSATINDPAPPLVEKPPELEEILAKALAKNPKDRYQHAGDLGLDLRRFLNAWQSKSLPSMRGTSAAVPKTRWLWIAATIVLLLAVPAAWWLGRLRAAGSFENPLANARFTRLTDFEGTELEAEISPDGKFVAFISDRDGPFDLWLTQVGTGHFLNLTQGKQGEVLEPTRSTGFSGDGAEIWLRGGPAPNQAPIRLMPLMGGPPRPFLPNNSVAVSWSRDGSRIVYHTGSRNGDPIFVADRTGANAKEVFIDPNPGGHCHFPVWSPDGNWIYFVRGIQATSEMDIWRVAPSGGLPERFTNRNANIASLAPMDARNLLYVSPAEDGSGPWLYALDLENRASRRISYGVEQYLSVAASGDGRRLVATVASPSAALWKVPILDRPATEGDVRPFVLPTVRALAPRFGAGSLFYLSSLGGGDELWRYREGTALEIRRGAESPLLSRPPSLQTASEWQF